MSRKRPQKLGRIRKKEKSSAFISKFRISVIEKGKRIVVKVNVEVATKRFILRFYELKYLRKLKSLQRKQRDRSIFGLFYHSRVK